MADTPSTTAAPTATPTPWQMPRPSRLAMIIGLSLALVGVLLVLAAWRLPPFDTEVQRTEDAYVRGHTTIIAPQVAGYVWRVRVEDFQQVRAGDLLVEIDPRPFDRRVEQAHAALAVRIADLDNNRQSLKQASSDIQVQEAGIGSVNARLAKAQLDAKRSADLVSDGSLSRREHDADVATLAEAVAAARQARATRERAAAGLQSARVNAQALAAQVEQARAAYRDAQLDRSYADIRAPRDGVVSEVGVRLGQFASAGTPFMFLVPADRWIVAYYKERQVRRMHPGQRAWFTVDALGGAVVHGHVERMAPAAASEFSALKPENGTGNFTKVPQRIPVRISIDPSQPVAARMMPGMSVEAYVDTNS